MKIIKLDYRYALHSKWQYAIVIGTNKKNKSTQVKYAIEFEKMFGPYRTVNPAYSPIAKSPFYLYNNEWYNDTVRGRINFNNESIKTMLLLMDIK